MRWSADRNVGARPAPVRPSIGGFCGHDPATNVVRAAATAIGGAGGLYLLNPGTVPAGVSAELGPQGHQLTVHEASLGPAPTERSRLARDLHVAPSGRGSGDTRHGASFSVQRGLLAGSNVVGSGSRSRTSAA